MVPDLMLHVLVGVEHFEGDVFVGNGVKCLEHLSREAVANLFQYLEPAIDFVRLVICHFLYIVDIFYFTSLF